MSLKAKLEAVIYAAEEPVTLAQLSALFAADALEWKAEQEAASAGQTQAAAEPLPLLAGEFDSPELNQTPADPAAPEPVAPEPVEQLSPEPGSEASPETGSEPEPAPPDEATADDEREARRLVRLRDREVSLVLRQLLDELIASYASDSRGIEIREIAGGYRMATKPECHDAVRSFVTSLKPPLKLSLPALETLAVVAYKQPVTAPEVNDIRGVESVGVLGTLLARKLIATAGRKQVIGRPILYKTTREFLLRFGLKDVAELPSMEEFEKMASLELDEPEPASGAVSPDATTTDLDFEADETAAEPVGQGFSPDIGTDDSSGASQAAEKLNAEGGGGFNPRIKPTESMLALATEGCFSLISPEISSFSAACSAPEVSTSDKPAQIPQTPETTQTAETAGSTEPLSTGEAAPAAPPATEQAETENSPHGEETREDR